MPNSSVVSVARAAKFVWNFSAVVRIGLPETGFFQRRASCLTLQHVSKHSRSERRAKRERGLSMSQSSLAAVVISRGLALTGFLDEQSGMCFIQVPMTHNKYVSHSFNAPTRPKLSTSTKAVEVRPKSGPPSSRQACTLYWPLCPLLFGIAQPPIS